MKRHTLLYTNILICFIIIVGFTGTVVINYSSNKQVLQSELENVSLLASEGISLELNTILDKPLTAVRTMANDYMLKLWLDKEESMTDVVKKEQMQNYLTNFQKKFGYEQVYVISPYTKNCYTNGQMLQKIKPDTQKDQWYYNFLHENAETEIIIDEAGTNDKTLALDIICKMSGIGKKEGVIGITIKSNYLQRILENYEKNFGLKAYLMDEEGKKMVSSKEVSLTKESANLYDNPALGNYRKQITDNHTSKEVRWYEGNKEETCYVTQYVPNLNWYIVVEKGASDMYHSFREESVQKVLIMLVILMLVLFVISKVIQKYNSEIVKVESLDALTKIPSRKSFNAAFTKMLKRQNCTGYSLFLFDIDRFKHINDEEGHLYGDKVLHHVARVAEDRISGRGIVARWGGDEFVGVLYNREEKVENILKDIVDSLRTPSENIKIRITLSVGVTKISSGKNLQDLIEEADEALYRAKENGRNQICYHKNK